MAQEILLVNPRRRGRRKGRTAKQRAATKRMIAANRRGGRTTKKRRRRRNPIGPYAKTGLGKYVSNPRRRRRPARKRTTVATRRRRMRNPRMTAKGVINKWVIPSLQAGAGAVLLDISWGYLPVPAQLKTGPFRHVAKGAGAVLLGWAVGQVAGRRMGDTMALGALTVTAYNAIRETVGQFAPGIPLGYYSAGANAGYDPQLGYYVGSPRMTVNRGESVPAARSGGEMGYYVQEGVGQQY